MKYALSIFTTLAIIIGALLFVQYQVHSTQVDYDSKDFQFAQEIEIDYRNNSLDVRQTFKNLPTGEVAITIPAAAQAVDCFLETENSCKRLDLNKMHILPGETKSQTISYVIPLTVDLSQNQTFRNIFATLDNGTVQYSTVHISTDSATNGQWVMGIPLVGEQQLSLVNYTMFSGKGNVADLYWDTQKIAQTNLHEQITLYTPYSVSAEFIEDVQQMKWLNDSFISIVQGNPIYSGERILFMEEVTLQTVQTAILYAQLEQLYQFDENVPLWLKEVVMSSMTDELIGSEKAQAITSTLKEKLGEKQWRVWQTKLSTFEGKALSVEMLNEALSEVLNNQTNYFVKNSEVDYVYPFYYIDGRPLIVNGSEPLTIDLIFYEGKVLYNADQLLPALGYTAYVGENGYYVNSESRIFRFPQGHNFYVYNQRRYETTSEPFTILDGEHYIEESWFQRLFLVNIKKQEAEIIIQQNNE
jgi:hypothetical protein